MVTTHGSWWNGRSRSRSRARTRFGDSVRRHEIRVDKSWDRLFDGEIGLSVDDGKEKIMAALQTRWS